MKKLLIVLLLAILSLGVFSTYKVKAQEKTTLLFFWAEGCPHCRAEDAHLAKLQNKYPNLSIQKFEVTKNKDNQKRLIDLSKKLKFDANGVPVTIMGNKYITGYTEGTTDQTIEDMISNLGNSTVLKAKTCKINTPCDGDAPSSRKIKLPIIGEIETKNLSLPVLAIVIGTLDGFNPCSLWVLLFLASLLIETGDRKKMLIYGGVFCLTEAITYALFMTAWLNLLLFIGFILWFRLGIGIFSFCAGGFNISQWWKNRKKNDGCSVTNHQQKKRIFAKIKKIAKEEKMIFAIAGIVVLAFSVNLIEMFCSAGLPAIYTQVLALNQLSKLQYAFYIFLYVCFFMIDDLIVFGAALITFSLKGISTKLAKYTHLIGGIIMLLLGLLLIFKPTWLMFG